MPYGVVTTPGITPLEFLERYKECVNLWLDWLGESGIEYNETFIQ